MGVAPSKRIEYFDVAKGILILFLLLSHLRWIGGGSEGSYPRMQTLSHMYFLVATFFMQCFFIITGYCTTFNKQASLFVRNQIRQLLIPLIVFTLISYVGMTLGCGKNSGYSASGFFTWAAYWFMWALLISKAIIYILLKICSKPAFYLSISLALLIICLVIRNYGHGSNPICYQHGLGSCFFVALGHFCKNHKEFYEKARRMSAFLYPWLMVILVIYKFEFPIFDVYIKVSMRQIPLFLAITIMGSFACLYYSELVRGRIKDILIFYGINSIIVYGLNAVLIWSLTDFFYSIICPSGLYAELLYLFLVLSGLLAMFGVCIWIFRLKGIKWLMGR